MRQAGREVPEISFFHIDYFWASILVQNGHAAVAIMTY
jgi:hypothetical protein